LGAKRIFCFSWGVTFSGDDFPRAWDLGRFSAPRLLQPQHPFGCGEASVPAGFAAELSAAVSDAAGDTAGKMLPFFCAS